MRKINDGLTGQQRYAAKHRAELTQKMRDKRNIAKTPKTPPIPLRLTPTEAAYIAGFFDGEGMVRINKGYNKGKHGPRPNPVYFLLTQIANSNLDVLDWITERVGGHSIEVRVPSKRRHWKFVKKSINAAMFLEAILPYLIVKREQAELALEFQKLQSEHQSRYEPGRRGPITRSSEEIAYKEHYFNKLSELKRP